MKGFGPFLFGAVIGGAAVFATLSYHFVRTKDGFEVIPKLSPTFNEAYVDARIFNADEWQRRKGLTAAILQAGKWAIIGDAAIDQAIQAVNGWLPEVSRAPGAAPQR
jgi:hypothetical protein